MLLVSQQSLKLMGSDWPGSMRRDSRRGHLQDSRVCITPHHQCSRLVQALGRPRGAAGQKCPCEAHVHC